MDSKHNVDNFQSVLLAKTAKFPPKKGGGKFGNFGKQFLTDIIGTGQLLDLRSAQIRIYHLMLFIFTPPLPIQ